MVSLSLYESREKRRVVLRLILPHHITNLQRLQENNPKIDFQSTSRVDSVLVELTSFEKFESSSLSLAYAASQAFDMAVAGTVDRSFIKMMVDYTVVSGGDLLGSHVSYIDENTLQISGRLHETKKAFTRIVNLLIKDVFEKVVDFHKSEDEVEAEEVDFGFVQRMINKFKIQGRLRSWCAYQIILQTKRIMRELPSLVDINVPDSQHITVCGDVHGQFYDLLNIFKLNGYPSKENPYLFNGDFVDRGAFSVETILTLFAFKCMCPSSIYLGRGNHESRDMNSTHGFRDEVRYKMKKQFMDLFACAFDSLPLAHVINKKILVVHGGLFSADGVKLRDIRAIDRFCEPPDEGLMCELLWSDPQPFPGRRPSKRGVGVSFGGDVTARFLKDNNLDLLVRSHEVKEDGYEVHHKGKLITVFSAPNYCDTERNKGAFIKFVAPKLKPEISMFTAVPHPDAR